REARSPYWAPGFRPGRLGLGLGSPLENGAAWRLRERSASSSSLRSRSISASALSKRRCVASLSLRRKSTSFSSSLVRSDWSPLFGAFIQGTITERRGFVQPFDAGTFIYEGSNAVNNYGVSKTLKILLHGRVLVCYNQRQ